MSIKPDLYDHYPITSLPRIPDLKLNEKIKISIPSNNNTIDLGISKSNISTYLIKPSPKLLWSHSLNPTTVVNAIDTTIYNDNKIYLVSLTDRNKIDNILLIKAKINDNTIEPATDTFEIKLKAKCKCINLRILSEDKYLIVYENGTVEFLKFENNELSLGSGTNVEDNKLLNSTFINDLTENNELFLLTISQKRSSLLYKLYSIKDNESIIEINSSTTESKSKNPLFAYISGILYQYIPESKLIESISITNFKALSTVSTSSIIDENDNDLTSIHACAPDRLLISHSDTLYLINFKYEALLSKFVSKSSKTGNFKPDQIYLNLVSQIKGSSQSTQLTNAYFINLKDKDMNVYLNSIELNVGFNKIDECLGKSINGNPNQNNFNQVLDIFDIDEDKERENSTELHEIYDSLKTAMESENINKWESILIPYLKNNKQWSEIKIAKPKNYEKIYNFKEFEAENDRIIDINFLNSILDLIFQINDDGLTFKNFKFIPEYTLMYLLTNPLFPNKYSSGLIELFDQLDLKVLLRQTINTCPRISCKELVNQLFKQNMSDEILIDLINRIINEFNHREILINIKQINNENNNSIDIVNLISNLIKLNSDNIWYLIEILIDVRGLLTFGNNENLENLLQIVDSKLNLIESNCFNLSLTNKLLSKNTNNNSKNEIENLLLSNQEDKTKAKLNNEKISNYSIETVEFI
ncbi:unnamed protein product [Candida verbasci]|uniref:U3 small nucleolar RNA-associated protein 8 n=1 Tax=Candida verbasci TaxID=1227364 RepID=A0A9W4XH07_9ASCO|nr:unnamed protein product [Candida verbasci]